MKRREFLSKGTLAAGVLLGSNSIAAEDGAKLGRIACSSTTFRGRFPEMSLLDFPKFLKDELGLAKVEIWSRHMTDDSLEFCGKLKEAAAEVDSEIINIQLDHPGYHFSEPDEAKRRESVEFVKGWMDRAKACGATSLRANTGGKKGEEFNLDVTADPFYQLAGYGEKIGVKILIENHGGHSMVADNINEIINGVASRWCRSLPDFGNISGSQEERETFLKEIMFYAHLISAKGQDFDADLNHLPYDIGSCVRASEAAGFKGVYSIEQWSKNAQPVDDLSIAKRIRDLILENLR